MRTKFEESLRRALDGQNVPGITRTRLLNSFTYFLIRLPAILKGGKAELLAEHSRCDDLFNDFMKAVLDRKTTRAELWMTLSTLIQFAAEDYQQAEELQQRPVI